MGCTRLFLGNTGWTGDGASTLVSTKSETERIYTFRVKNCIAAQALVAAGSNNRRTVFLEAYPIENGELAAAATISATMESGTPGILSLEGLDKTIEYAIVVSSNGSGSGGSSNGNSNFYEIAFVAAPLAPQVKSYTIAGIKADIDQAAKTITAELPFGSDKAQAIKDAVIVLGGTATESSYNADYTTLTVTDGTTPVEYALNITVSTVASAEKELLNVSVAGKAVKFEGTAGTVNFREGTDITALDVEFELSLLATASIESGSKQDFTNPLTITVTAQDGSTQEYTITVGFSAGAILYIVDGGNLSANDTQIHPALAAKYDVTLYSAEEATIAYEGYDLVVLSEKPGSKKAGALAVGSIIGKVPVLNFKSYMFGKNDAWLTGAGAQTADTAVTVAAAFATHPIFEGLTLDGSNLSLLSKAQGNGLQAVAGSTDQLVLANSINDPTAATILENNDGKAANKMITIAISDQAYNVLNDNCLALIDNAVDYLLDNTALFQAEEASGDVNALENATLDKNVVKVIENGQLVIIRDGVRYNALGARL